MQGFYIFTRSQHVNKVSYLLQSLIWFVWRLQLRRTHTGGTLYCICICIQSTISINPIICWFYKIIPNLFSGNLHQSSNSFIFSTILKLVLLNFTLGIFSHLNLDSYALTLLTGVALFHISTYWFFLNLLDLLQILLPCSFENQHCMISQYQGEILKSIYFLVKFCSAHSQLSLY